MCDTCKTATIVDDDAGFLAASRFSFEAEGHAVRTYRSAEALLGDPVPPDRGYLIVDVNLGGIDGLEPLRQLQAQRVRLPAVLIATPSAALVRRVTLGAIALVEKPLMTDEVFAQVRSMLAGARVSPTP